MKNKKRFLCKLLVATIAMMLFYKWYRMFYFWEIPYWFAGIREVVITNFSQKILLSNFPLYFVATCLALVVWMIFAIIDQKKLSWHFTVRKEMDAALGGFLIWYSLIHYYTGLFIGVTLFLVIVWKLLDDERKKRQQQPFLKRKIVAMILMIWFLLRLTVIMDWGNITWLYDIIRYWIYMIVVYYLCSGWEKREVTDVEWEGKET